MIAQDAPGMELILWRHADAGEPVEASELDLARRLTTRGRKQAQRVAGWLAMRLPERYLLLSSPAQRTLETARALTDRIRIDERLSPGASAADVLAAAGWPHPSEGRSRVVVVVGHQPCLGEAAALALAASPTGWPLKKGGLFWLIARADASERPVMLRAAITPDLA